ncbi:MAG: flagellar motor switch protein FliG [Desulfobacterales bacterium]|jgi:flagellar motor switch protein FliG|nr:flagellar motor switch protein FliG [Desulfobacterales bacterium]
MDPKRIAGPVKAAILIHGLGKPLAETLLKRFTELEKERVQEHLSQIRTISPDVVEQIAREFADIVRQHKSRQGKLSSGDRPAAATDAGDSDAETSGLEAIRTLNADQIYDLIKDEQPQTIAIILVHLKTRVASDVISKLPDEIKTKVAIRVVNLDKVTSTIVDEVNEILKDILKTKKDSIANVSGGVDRLAEILNQTDEISSQLILNEMEESDMEMAAQIKQRMFVFEDIILVDDRGVQKLLRKVETMELAIALKAASEEAREKVFKNMSSRAGEMLKEEIEDMGPVRMKEVEDAQQNITNFIQEMETKGELIIAGRRGEEIIA